MERERPKSVSLMKGVGRSERTEVEGGSGKGLQVKRMSVDVPRQWDERREERGGEVLSSLISRCTNPHSCIHPTASHNSPKILRANPSVKPASWCQSARKSKSSPPGQYERTRAV